MSITNYLTHEHRACDDLFAKAEQAAARNDRDEAKTAFENFAGDTLLHFKKEENELFPAFEAHTGNTQGPTMVMRYEHDQVRGLLGKMAEALENKDKDAFLSLSESMMILLQQHNMKEEQMLYAMCDRLLPTELNEETIQKMQATEL